MWKGCKIESLTAENGQLIPTTTIEDDDNDRKVIIKILGKGESLEGDSEKPNDVENKIIGKVRNTFEDDHNDRKVIIKILGESESLEGDSQKNDVKNKIIEKVQKYLFHECESPLELSAFEFLIDHGINIVSEKKYLAN